MLYKGRVLNSGKIIDKSFKVYIPQLCAGLKETDQVFSENLKTDRILSKSYVSSTIKYTSYIEAKNLSDYPTSMSGLNVFEMERADGVTMIETTNASEGSNVNADWNAPDAYTPVPIACLVSGAPHPPHVHRILQGMKFYSMKMTNMNNIDIKKGTECFVLLNGNEAYIVRFIGVHTQSKEDYDYVKK
jgi:hypothetical protein